MCLMLVLKSAINISLDHSNYYILCKSLLKKIPSFRNILTDYVIMIRIVYNTFCYEAWHFLKRLKLLRTKDIYAAIF